MSMSAEQQAECEVAMSVSEVAHALLGHEVTLVTEDGVLSGRLTDYDVGEVRLEEDVANVPLRLRVEPQQRIEITVEHRP